MIGAFWAVWAAPLDVRRNVLGAFGLRFAFRFSVAAEIDPEPERYSFIQAGSGVSMSFAEFGMPA